MLRSNDGSVLVTSLLLLLILSLLTLTGLQNSTLEERLSGQVRSRELAFSAAEAALGSAEQSILARVESTVPCTRRDELGLWHRDENWLDCLQTSVAPCTQGWCGPRAEEPADEGCTAFEPNNPACWTEALSITEIDVSAKTVMQLRECWTDENPLSYKTQTCQFNVFARGFSDHTDRPAATVLLQSQFEVVATPFPTHCEEQP